MQLKERVTTELTASMKAGDKLRTETLRGIRALILEFEKSGVGREMNAEDELKMLMTAAKKRRESIDIYSKNNRPEQAAKEQAELEIITEYLPKQLSQEEIKKRVVEVIAETGVTGPAEINKVIRILMKEMKGKADGKLIQEIVKTKLTALGA